MISASPRCYIEPDVDEKMFLGARDPQFRDEEAFLGASPVSSRRSVIISSRSCWMHGVDIVVSIREAEHLRFHCGPGWLGSEVTSPLNASPPPPSL